MAVQLDNRADYVAKDSHEFPTDRIERLHSTNQYRPARLSEIRVDYGPSELLGQFFLMADYALRKEGISLQFCTFEELLRANRENSESWRATMPTYDPSNGLVNDKSSFALLGRDSSGQIVSAQAAHVFDWGNTSFGAEAESLRLLYAEPASHIASGEYCIVNAKTAARLSGRVALVGGAWLHPAWRKHGRFGLLSRITRAYAYTRWKTDLTVGLCAPGLIAGGHHVNCGFPHVEEDVEINVVAYGVYRGAVIWTTTEEGLDDLAVISAQLQMSLRNGVVVDAAQDERAATRQAHR